MDALDNPVWHALTGPHANLAEGSGGARRYQPEYTMFAGLPDTPTATDWADLGALIGPDGTAVLVPEYDPPAGWKQLGTFPCHQMVLGPEPAASTTAPAALVELGPADADAMAALVVATEPGPWGARTHELGTYVGVRDGDRLVAMAGVRMHLPARVEISAVCTDPEYRGRGYAAAMVTEVCRRTVATGARPFLHVVATNEPAIRLYEQLGFTRRIVLHPGMYQAPST